MPSIRETTGDGGPSLVLNGVVGIAQAELLHRAARNLLQLRQSVHVDCTGAEHLDTSALQILAALKTGLRSDGHDMRMTGLSDVVRRYLSISGMEQALLEGAPGSCPDDSEATSRNAPIRRNQT